METSSLLLFCNLLYDFFPIILLNFELKRWKFKKYNFFSPDIRNDEKKIKFQGIIVKVRLRPFNFIVDSVARQISFRSMTKFPSFRFEHFLYFCVLCASCLITKHMATKTCSLIIKRSLHERISQQHVKQRYIIFHLEYFLHILHVTCTMSNYKARHNWICSLIIKQRVTYVISLCLQHFFYTTSRVLLVISMPNN